MEVSNSDSGTMSCHVSDIQTTCNMSLHPLQLLLHNLHHGNFKTLADFHHREWQEFLHLGRSSSWGLIGVILVNAIMCCNASSFLVFCLSGSLGAWKWTATASAHTHPCLSPLPLCGRRKRERGRRSWSASGRQRKGGGGRRKSASCSVSRRRGRGERGRRRRRGRGGRRKSWNGRGGKRRRGGSRKLRSNSAGSGKELWSSSSSRGSGQ